MPTWRVDRLAHALIPLLIVLDAEDDALVYIGFEALPSGLARHAARHGASLVVERRRGTAARRQLIEYLEAKRRSFDLPLRLLGTEFQVQAWEALLSIEYGDTSSYGRQAAALGRPAAARAVGRANATNPIPIVVPCHRVIGSTGALTGFGGGLPVKRWLLELERTRSIPPWLPDQRQLALW